jgi:adenosylcobinamide-GDP ribazoletransferase
MQILQSTSNRILAAFIFFTRLPFYKVKNVPAAYYSTVVEHWPLTGWLTGGIMAAILYFGALCTSPSIAVLLAMGTRILITGALHEDGLADFFDGFGGGGNDRQRILDIMKDSRIGTYGVLGLVMYALLLYASLISLPYPMAALMVFAGDPFCKMIAAQLTQQLPYARTAATAKNKTVYRSIGTRAAVSLTVQGLLPCIPLVYTWYAYIDIWMAIAVPCLVMFFLSYLMRKKIQGYTGDCCGATFLLCELSLYITLATSYQIIIHHHYLIPSL